MKDFVQQKVQKEKKARDKTCHFCWKTFVQKSSSVLHVKNQHSGEMSNDTSDIVPTFVPKWDPQLRLLKQLTCLINWHWHSKWSVHLLWNIKCFFSYWWWEDNTSWDVYHWKWNLYLWSVWTISKSTFATHPWHLTSVWIILLMRKLMNQTLCLLMKPSHRRGIKKFRKTRELILHDAVTEFVKLHESLTS